MQGVLDLWGELCSDVKVENVPGAFKVLVLDSFPAVENEPASLDIFSLALVVKPMLLLVLGISRVLCGPGFYLLSVLIRPLNDLYFPEQHEIQLDEQLKYCVIKRVKNGL